MTHPEPNTGVRVRFPVKGSETLFVVVHVDPAYAAAYRAHRDSHELRRLNGDCPGSPLILRADQPAPPLIEDTLIWERVEKQGNSAGSTPDGDTAGVQTTRKSEHPHSSALPTPRHAVFRHRLLRGRATLAP